MRAHGSTHHPSVAWPGTGRITLALLAVVPAAMAFPWPSARDRCLLGVAAVVVVLLFGRWRGLFFTTILRRRLAVMRRNSGEPSVPGSGAGARSTVLLQIVPPAPDPGELPLMLIAGYVKRYGLRADAIRVTSRDTGPDGGAPMRDTWIGLTLSATTNLAALQARSPRIPLEQTAQVAVRRLADHFREIGWTANVVAPESVPQPSNPSARETWHAVRHGRADYVAAYRVTVDDALPDMLAAIRSYPARETWTALEIAGSGTGRTLAVACALRTEEPPRHAPLPGLIPHQGNHGPALLALDPLSTERLDGPSNVADDLLARLHWTTAPTPKGPATRNPRHAAASRT